MVDREAQVVVRYHTAGRRQPMLIGKDAAGRRLPGGPYTVYQVLAVAAVAAVLWNTRPIWAAGLTALSALLVIGAAAIGAGFLTGRLDFSGRNPFWILLSLLGALRALAGARPGRVGGRSLPGGKPWKVKAFAVAAAMPAQVDHEPNLAVTELTLPPANAELPGAGDSVAHLPPQVSVQPDVLGVRLTPLETFLAAVGKVA